MTIVTNHDNHDFAMEDAQRADIVFALFGCSLLTVIRRTDHGLLLVAGCWVEQLMDGQAFCTVKWDQYNRSISVAAIRSLIYSNVMLWKFF